MKVAFVHPALRHHRFSENLKVVDEEFILAPPIVLAYSAAIAEKAAHDVILIDAHIMNLTKETVYERLLEFKPDILAFRLDTYTFQDAYEWISYLKQRLTIPVIVGGINMSLYPRETMSYNVFDYGLAGEAIESFPLLLDAAGSGASLENIPGLYYRDKNGHLCSNALTSQLVDFDRYPYPARHLLPNHLYRSFVSQRKNFTVMLTTTGCPYKCNFCAIAGLNHYRERSPLNVVDEIEECYYKYGVREIDFFDACFFTNKKRCMELLRELKKRKLDITWTCRSRVDTVDEELLSRARACGLRMVFWGIESSSQKTLDEVDKGITPGKTEDTLRLANKLRIRNLGFVMLGNPGETRKEIHETVRWIKKLKLDYVQICRTIPKPGSLLHKIQAGKEGYDYWREFVLGNEEEKRIYVSQRMMSEAELENLLNWAYYSFYFRLAYIWHTLIGLRSLGEFMRYLRVAIRMLLHFFYTDVEITKSSKIFHVLAHRWRIRM
ncbi:B12-binding domain-containing radical SAM protein [Elusimicrobiota bacterium]